ncbi:MAG: hypothetical protein H6729_01630 [Deltaproteobacteria bacterium]|nr:hypothetical protein [Deltaproteobacteria bacterium]
MLDTHHTPREPHRTQLIPSTRRVVATVRRLVQRAQQRADQEDSTIAVPLSAELSRLHEHLVRDYASVEVSSLYQEVPLHHPRFSRTLDSLKSCHTQTLRELRDILDELWWADWADTPVGVVARVNRLLDQVERVDTHENEILQKSANQDLPAVD